MNELSDFGCGKSKQAVVFHEKQIGPRSVS